MNSRTGSPKSPRSPRLSPRRAGAGAPRSPRLQTSPSRTRIPLRTSNGDYKESKVENKSTENTLSLEELFSNSVIFGGGGLQDIMASYASYYYQIKLTLLDEQNIDSDTFFMDRENVFKFEFLLMIQKDYLNKRFLEDDRRFIEAIVDSYFPELVGYRIVKIEYDEIDYRDVKNKEVVVLDIYDIARLFEFYNYISQRYEPIQRSDEIIKDKIIELIETKKYMKYNSALKDLHPRFINEILPYIPVNDYKLVEPLFKGKEPIIFKTESVRGEGISENEMNRRREESYRERSIRNKFIVKVLIQSIKDNNMPLCNAIINRMPNVLAKRSNRLLLEYCIEVAKEYNRNDILQIIVQKYNVLNV